MGIQDHITAYRAEIRAQHQNVMHTAMAPLLPYEEQLRQSMESFAEVADFEAVFGREFSVKQDYKDGIASIVAENTSTGVFSDLLVTCSTLPEGTKVSIQVQDRTNQDPNSRNFAPSAACPDPEFYGRVVTTPAEMVDFVEAELGQFIAQSLEFEAGNDETLASSPPGP